MTESDNPLSVVLVHGGFVDGSGWQPAYRLLSNDGYGVSVVQNPTLSLDDDVAASRLIIDAQDAPVVLVGHSYGGAVITEAGNDPNVAGLVDIAAFARRQRVGEHFARRPATGSADPADPAAARGLSVPRPRPVPFVLRGRRAARPGGLHGRRSGPLGVDALDETISEAARRTKPNWYLLTTEDRMIPPLAQRMMAERARATVVEVAGSHSIFLSHPEAVAGLIRTALAEPAVTRVGT